MDERSVKEIIREEWKKLSGLTWGQRLGYIWDYYKPLMVVMLVIAAAISIGVTIYHNLQINHVFQTYWVNSNSFEFNSDEVAAEFAEYIGGIGKNDEITVDASVQYSLTENTQYSMAAQMKLTALMATGDMDVLLLDGEIYEHFMEVGAAFQELSELYPEEQLKIWEPYLVKGENTESGGEGVYALLVTDAPVLKRLNAYPEGEVYAVVMTGTKHPEECAQFLNYLLGY
ncbi:MAG: hypothetical protein Q4C59_09445 [Lachnospiraceae bacterium]|nr:hypothetical protein [Lachnospiraceae bacterium]